MKLLEIIPLFAMIIALISAGLFAYTQISGAQFAIILTLCAIFGVWAVIDLKKGDK